MLSDVITEVEELEGISAFDVANKVVHSEVGCNCLGGTKES
jgi:hypothetical protein